MENNKIIVIPICVKYEPGFYIKIGVKNVPYPFYIFEWTRSNTKQQCQRKFLRQNKQYKTWKDAAICYSVVEILTPVTFIKAHVEVR